MIKANNLSLLSKILAVVMVLAAVVLSLLGYAVDMTQIIAGATFIATSFLTVDISKIKTANTNRGE